MGQPSPLYKRHRFPGEIISHAVWLYYRFLLSYRDVEELAGRTRDHRELRDRAAVVPEVRAGVRRRAAPAPSQTGRQMARGRGAAQDQREEALVVAGSGPRWGGVG